MRQEAGDASRTLKPIAVSTADVLLIAFWSVLGGALCYVTLSRALPSLLGWHIAVARGIGFFFGWLSIYTPLKIWSQVRGRRMASGGKFLLALAAGSIVVGLLDLLMA